MEYERFEKERLECQHLECERLEHVHTVEQQGPMLGAIYHMQDVNSNLSPDEQVTLADLFTKDHNSARVYLALKSDPVQKAWIKRKLAQANSG